MKITKKLFTLTSSIGVELLFLRKYFRFSNTVLKNNSKSKLIGRIIANYHVLEKGLTMPEPKQSFGLLAMRELLRLLNLYIENGFEKDDVQFLAAINSIHHYKNYHIKTDNLLIEDKIEIDRLINQVELDNFNMDFKIISATYFDNIQSLDFMSFSAKRFSLRNYSNDALSKEEIEAAVNLAMNAPSACNRQSNKVYISLSKDILNQTFSVQTGNRGFGHLAKGVIICSSELGVYDGFNEIHEPYLNSGMFIMNLVYALQYYKIGSCILNWAVFNQNDKILRTVYNIPKNEMITAMIALGKLPNKEFSIANSKRYKGNDIMKYV